MKFLADERLYSSTQHCLKFLREITESIAPLKTPERYHMYWCNDFSSKQAFAVKSFLATQDLESAELWLWLDSRNGYDGYAANPLLGPLLPFIKVKRFDPDVEAKGTPLERRPELYHSKSPTRRSNFLRFVVLYKYGGIYVDMDTMFLRDIRILLGHPTFQDEFCYHWSSHMPYANSAVLRLHERSETGRALLARCVACGSCRPKDVLRFAENKDLDLLVLPCVFYDPLWPHHDQQDSYDAAPFSRFEDFFRRFDSRFACKSNIRSYKNFFPGAFTYHWHNFWDVEEHSHSYFGMFNEEFDLILKDKLGIEVARV
jgi:hypothetical protein